MPLHFLSWFLSPEQYTKRSYTQKRNLMIVSPDTHPMKTEILDIIQSRFPEMKIRIIQKMTYEEYKDLISWAKWALTFGEGIDGYFVEMAFSGGISFALYKPAFFTEDFRALRTVYADGNDMAKRICLDMEDLDNEPNFKNYQQEEFDLCYKYFNHEQYVKNIRLFYEGKYTIP